MAAGDAEYIRDAEHTGDAEYTAYEELEDITEHPLLSGLSDEYAAGVTYEQLEEDAAYWADADFSDDEIADARLKPAVEKLAKALTNHYPEIRALIPNRKGYELWETMVAAIMQILAFFAAQFDANPAFLQYRDKRVEEGSKAEQKLSRLLTKNMPLFLPLNGVMQYARVIGSRAFVEYGYDLPRGSPWIEFIDLATVMAKQCKKLIEFGERQPGAIYEKSRILVHVSWLRRWLRAKINPSSFRREQSYWKHCWDIVTLRVVKNGILDVGKSRPEPELGIVGKGDTESEIDDKDTDVEIATIKEKEEAAADDELGEVLDPRLRGATGPVAVQSEEVDVDIGGKSDGRNEKYEAL